MTKDELKRWIVENEQMLEAILPLSDGQDCSIYKAMEFSINDEIIYIPDVWENHLDTKAEPPLRGRLCFEDQPTPEADSELPHRQQRRYEKAERRVEQASRKLEKAQEKIPTQRRAHLEKQYDSESGKVRRHLRFEKEAVPENANPALPKRAGGAMVRTARTAAVLKAHQKLCQRRMSSPVIWYFSGTPMTRQTPTA